MGIERSFGIFSDIDTESFSEMCRQQWLVRDKLSLKKNEGGKFVLEFWYFNRTQKIEVVGDTADEVFVKFLKDYSEDMFGTEFELKE